MGNATAHIASAILAAMETIGSHSGKNPGTESLNVAIVYATVSACTVGIAICMIGWDFKKGNGLDLLIWVVVAAASLLNTFLGARKIRSAARRFPG
jgi:hypothetical protein